MLAKIFKIIHVAGIIFLLDSTAVMKMSKASKRGLLFVISWIPDSLSLAIGLLYFHQDNISSTDCFH